MRKVTFMNEQRREERFTPTQQSTHGLYLYVADQCMDVQAVWDVSPFGVGLQVDCAIDKGAMVRLMYEYKSAVLQVHGTVMWCTIFRNIPNNSDLLPSYRVGISLGSEDVEANVLFFRYMTGH